MPMSPESPCAASRYCPQAVRGCRKRAIRLEIKRVVVPLAPNQKGELVTERVPDAEFIEHVRVVDGHIGND